MRDQSTVGSMRFLHIDVLNTAIPVGWANIHNGGTSAGFFSRWFFFQGEYYHTRPTSFLGGSGIHKSGEVTYDYPCFARVNDDPVKGPVEAGDIIGPLTFTVNTFEFYKCSFGWQALSDRDDLGRALIVKSAIPVKVDVQEGVRFGETIDTLYGFGQLVTCGSIDGIPQSGGTCGMVRELIYDQSQGWVPNGLIFKARNRWDLTIGEGNRVVCVPYLIQPGIYEEYQVLT